jgi:hypothetical protein
MSTKLLESGAVKNGTLDVAIHHFDDSGGALVFRDELSKERDCTDLSTVRFRRKLEHSSSLKVGAEEDGDCNRSSVYFYRHDPVLRRFRDATLVFEKVLVKRRSTFSTVLFCQGRIIRGDQLGGWVLGKKNSVMGGSVGLAQPPGQSQRKILFGTGWPELTVQTFFYTI